MGDSPRSSFFYISDDGEVIAMRLQDWKAVLMEQRARQLACWLEPFVKFPPRQEPASFNLDAVMRDLEAAGGGGKH